jgi:hypothetical protein
MDYPVTALVGHPNALILRFVSDRNLVTKTNLVPIETGKEFTTYVSLIDPDLFYQVLGDDGAQAKEWDTLEIAPNPTGPFGVLPSRVEVHRVECINLEAPLPEPTPADARFDLTDQTLWWPQSIKPETIQAGKVTEWQVGDDPIMMYTPPLDLCLANYTHIYVRMSAAPSEVEPRVVQIFYLLDRETEMGHHVITISLRADGKMHDYAFSLKALKLNPDSRLTGLRFDPVSAGSPNGGDWVQLEDLRLTKSSAVGSSKCIH